MSTLRPWQAKDLADNLKTPKRALCVEPRLGKTRLSIEYLKAWAPRSAIVIAPKTVCPFWLSEGLEQGYSMLDGFSGTVMDTLSVLSLHGHAKGLSGQGSIVVNEDRIRYIVEKYPKIHFDAVICDEFHRFKAVSAKRSKAYRKLAHRADYVRILSGTPTPNNYGNLWSPFNGLDEKDWFTSFTKFQQRYLICDQFFPSKILGYKNLQELENKLKKWATFVKREEVFGEDAWQIVERSVTLPASVINIYKKLAKEWIAELNGSPIIGTHALTRFLRFQQITSGFVGTEKGDQLIHFAKIDAICEDLEEIIESGEKAVVFCRYTWEIETYTKEIKERLKCRVRTIHGKTTPEERQVGIREINHGSAPAVIVVQIQTGSTGISLAGATHALFASETFSYAEQLQARDRIYSPGKNKCITFYRVPNTIDQYIAKTLKLKRSVNESVQNQKLEEILFG